jgi:hypothetical protein
MQQRRITPDALKRPITEAKFLHIHLQQRPIHLAAGLIEHPGGEVSADNSHSVRLKPACITPWATAQVKDTRLRANGPKKMVGSNAQFRRHRRIAPRKLRRDLIICRPHSSGYKSSTRAHDSPSHVIPG